MDEQNRPSLRTLLGVGILVAAGIRCAPAETPVGAKRTAVAAAIPTISFSPASARAADAPITTSADVPGDPTSLAKSDPAAFVEFCLNAYDRRVVLDYTCRFTKQEKVGRKLGLVERVAVRFRETPFSVDMRWLENAGAATRAVYVRDAWVDGKGRQLAWFKPAGSIIKLLISKIQQPIHGPRARKAARRTMDEFGFRSTLGLIDKYIRHGQARHELDLRYVGERSLNGRMTWVFERRLPFTGEDGYYPDALLRFQIDQEWLVPTACFSYADHAGTRLLGSYVISDVTWNVGLTDDDFDPEKLDF